MSQLFTRCFFVPDGQKYPECVQQIDIQKLSSKISSLETENQNDIFILILEYCKTYDQANFAKITNMAGNKKIYLPYSLTTLKNNIHVSGSLKNFPPNLLLIINNYCNIIFNKTS
jgi:hypothetical protein